MKKIVFLLVASIATASFSQVSTLETKGNKKFKAFSLEPAIQKYEDVGVENLTTDGLRNLSDAYRYLHNSEKAEENYAELVKRSDNKAEDLYMYAEVLLMNKKKSDWELWMDNFHQRLESNGRGQDFVASKGTFNKLKEDIGQFDSIKNLAINTDKEDFGTSYHGDKVVFASSRKTNMPIKRVWNWTGFPFLNIFEATETSNNELEDVKKLSKKINKKYHEGPADFSKDGKLMVFTRNNYENSSEDDRVKLKMFYRELDEEGEWGEIKGFDFNNKEYSVGQPTVTPDGKTIYFASDMPGGKGSIDLYKITRNNNGEWSQPINLGDEINTEGREMFPSYHKDDMLFFASDGQVGLGGLDMFVSKVEDGSFSNPQNLGYPANDSKDDFALLLNDDQTKGYFSSNRPGGKGSDDIYSFNLTRPFEFCKTIKGLAKDNNGNILPGSEVVLTDNEGKEIETITVGDDAAYNFCVPVGSYTLKGSKETYSEGSNTATTTESQKGAVEADVILEKDAPYKLVVDVKQKGGNPLEGVKTTVKNKLTGKEEVFYTNANGEFETDLIQKFGDNVDYELVFEKEGYELKTINHKQVLGKERILNLSAIYDLSLTPISGKLEIVEINAINFDFDKSYIRVDAAIELDKIVAVMNKYPNMVIELGSHTDCRATIAYNEALSSRRATSSANYIKSRITNPERIYSKGYGESKLLTNCPCEPTNESNCSIDQHFKNRRTEFKIIKKGSANIKIINNSPDSFGK